MRRLEDDKGVKVFVYGTLRKGEANAFLLNGTTCLGVCCLQSGFSLFDLGSYPAAIADARGPELVGEVYEITAETLQALDVLEECPVLYDRELVMTSFGEAWIYTYNGSLVNIPRLNHGDWCLAKHRED